MVCKRISSGPKHHLFGFHDLLATNGAGDLALSLEVEDINHPPLPGETCSSGIIPAEGGDFIPIHATHTWNYPQGARQQWIGRSDLFVCNDRDRDGRVRARVCDARKGVVVDTLQFPVHCLDAEREVAYWQDYDRLHMVGGYGYTPFPSQKFPASLSGDLPMDDGLWMGDLKSGEKELLVSIRDVAACGEKRPVETGYPHYLTHPMLNPSGSRIAFLHRYRIVDGGETTRLMTIGTDGRDLRCLAKGFLSHFTWIAGDELFIWGAHQPGLFAMREASFLRIPGAFQVAVFAKKILKAITRKSRSSNKGNSSDLQALSFLRIKDIPEHEMMKCASGVLTVDGHPMANPVDRHRMINDTYPDANGVRILMEYNLDSNKRYDVGTFKMTNLKPDKMRFDVSLAQYGLDRRIIRKFDQDLYLFTRSGYHCDLHPRWSSDGKFAYFDSIHEGTRQIYRTEA